MNTAVMMAVLLLVVFNFLVAAADDSSDCNWLCQVIGWFQGETVVGKATIGGGILV